MLFFFELFLAVCFAFFLAVLASFFNVVIFRTSKEESFAKGRSYCENCHRQIAWYDNVPLISFLILQGRCRYCHHQIKPIYFWTEAIAFVLGLVFVFAFSWLLAISSFSPGLLIVSFFIFFILLFILLADLQYLIVPDFLVMLLSIFVVVSQVLSQQNWISSFLATGFASLFFIGLYVVSKKILHKEALGMGDIKLMIPIAFFLSWPNTLVSVFLAFIIGGFFAMLMLLIGKKKFGQAVPFAPFLVLASLIAYFFGKAIWQGYVGLLF